VHRFITWDTFEERINDMIRSKSQLAEMTVGTGETKVGPLPTQELRALFEMRSPSTLCATAVVTNLQRTLVWQKVHGWPLGLCITRI